MCNKHAQNNYVTKTLHSGNVPPFRKCVSPNSLYRRDTDHTRFRATSCRPASLFLFFLFFSEKESGQPLRSVTFLIQPPEMISKLQTFLLDSTVYREIPYIAVLNKMVLNVTMPVIIIPSLGYSVYKFPVILCHCQNSTCSVLEDPDTGETK